jgi:Holliday junction resolvase-like predicted endonuclease
MERTAFRHIMRQRLAARFDVVAFVAQRDQHYLTFEFCFSPPRP